MVERRLDAFCLHNIHVQNSRLHVVLIRRKFGEGALMALLAGISVTLTPYLTHLLVLHRKEFFHTPKSDSH